MTQDTAYVCDPLPSGLFSTKPNAVLKKHLSSSSAMLLTAIVPISGHGERGETGERKKGKEGNGEEEGRGRGMI